MVDERSKQITQTHKGKDDEMRCPQPDMNADECHVQERHTADMIEKWFHFPHHLWRVPKLFLETNLEGDNIRLQCKFFLWTNPS